MWISAEPPSKASVRSPDADERLGRALNAPRGPGGADDGDIDTVPVAGFDVEPGGDDGSDPGAVNPTDTSATVEPDLPEADESVPAPAARSVAVERPQRLEDAGSAPLPDPGGAPEPDEPLEACGLIRCSPGFTCCNSSCGTCVPEGQSCDPTPCESRVQYPVSAVCGQNTCSVGEVCCNPTCGTCAPEGAACDTTPCTPRIR